MKKTKMKIVELVEVVEKSVYSSSMDGIVGFGKMQGEEVSSTQPSEKHFYLLHYLSRLFL